MSFRCKVSDCRFSWSHVTRGHKCGVCKRYGHGELECGSNFRRERLRVYYDDVVPNDRICEVDDCEYKFYHTTDAHHCPKCNKREAHTLESCQLSKTVRCPICRTENTINNPTTVMGLKEECAICMDKNAQVLFPTCKHCCVCVSCYEKLDAV